MYFGFFKEYIRIQPASNRDQTDDLDRYWLNSMIRNVQSLEKIYQSLEIDEVNFGVNIAIDKVFAPKIPKDLADALEATREFIKQGYGLDRQGLHRAWLQGMRKAHKKGKVDYSDVASIINRMTQTDPSQTILLLIFRTLLEI